MRHPSPSLHPRTCPLPTSTRDRLALACSLVLALAPWAGARAADLDHEGPVVEIPVSFQIRNVNNAPPPGCIADGGHYTVFGHIVGTRPAIRSPHPKTVSLLIGGFDSNGEWLWRGFDEPAGYDTAFELARLGGHITLSIDMLGHGESGQPRPGTSVCFGSQAEVLHQIVGQLRAGSYGACGTEPIAFSRVVLVGHDIGPAMANLEAHLYGDVDGLVSIIWANQGQTPFVLGLVAQFEARCAAGGDGEGEDFGDYYSLFGPPDAEFREALFHSADGAAMDAVIARRERNPCGYLFPNVRQDDTSRYAAIDVPVLLLYPEADPVFTRQGQEQQAAHFSGSPSVATVFLAGMSHFPMFEHRAACFRQELSEWLADPFAFEASRGEVSRACADGAE